MSDLSDELKILIVDDEEFNLDIMEDCLSKIENYKVFKARDGQEAWELLEKEPDIDLFILDRMMPSMNGIELAKKIKESPLHASKIIIMQTAAGSNKEILEGIASGVHFYLTKPYAKDVFLAMVNSAVKETIEFRNLSKEIQNQRENFSLVEKASFFFKTLENVHNLSNFLAQFFPNPERVMMGIRDLLLNAVEHGNLGITYQFKKELLLKGLWLEEIERRTALEENKNKKAFAFLERTQEEIILTIQDQGKGFNWEQYLDFDTERLTDPNGRGIAITKKMSFDSLEYQGCGNTVVCRILLKD